MLKLRSTCSNQKRSPGIPARRAFLGSADEGFSFLQLWYHFGVLVSAVCLPVRERISLTSSSRYGSPDCMKISWNHTPGGFSTYGRCHESHGKLVCVLPATKPQLIAP